MEFFKRDLSHALVTRFSKLTKKLILISLIYTNFNFDLFVNLYWANIVSIIRLLNWGRFMTWRIYRVRLGSKRASRFGTFPGRLCPISAAWSACRRRWQLCSAKAGKTFLWIFKVPREPNLINDEDVVVQCEQHVLHC